MEYKIFVPGRLCIIGEHSDWASTYKCDNDQIEKGSAIVTCLDQGITAIVSKSDKLIINDRDVKNIELSFNEMDLKKIIDSNSYFSFITATSYLLKQKYNVGPLTIKITEMTLPIGKGLSSSACICILTIKAFEKIYNLNINVEEEMMLAYDAEILAHSKCGKMDQVCALNNQISLMEFDGKTLITPLKPKHNYYFVIADLNRKKDTKKILDDLHLVFSNHTTEKEKNLILFLGKINNELVSKAKDIIENRTARELGELLIFYQMQFDKLVAPFSTELKAPFLHQLLSDDYIKLNSFGAKGVGSQGDGSIQILVKNKEEQKQMIRYLKKQYHLKGYSFVIKEVKHG